MLLVHDGLATCATFLVRRCVTHGMDFSLDGSHDVAEDVSNLQLE